MALDWRDVLLLRTFRRIANPTVVSMSICNAKKEGGMGTLTHGSSAYPYDPIIRALQRKSVVLFCPLRGGKTKIMVQI